MQHLNSRKILGAAEVATGHFYHFIVADVAEVANIAAFAADADATAATDSEADADKNASKAHAVATFVSSDRSSCTDDGLLYIYTYNFFRF